MKICMLAYSFYESDARIRQYATALVQRGDDVEVIALRRAGSCRQETINGVRVVRIQGRLVTEHHRITYLFKIVCFLFHAAAVLAWRQLRDGYNLVHVHSVPDFLVFAALVPRLCGVPVILDIHDLLPELYAGKFGNRRSGAFQLLVMVEKLSAAFADHVIVANDIWRERLISRSVRTEKCSTVRNYPDLTLFRPRSRRNGNGKFLIVYPGSLNWHQGVDIAICAFTSVADQLGDAEFHIYGEGASKPSLESLVQQLAMQEKIVFHSKLPVQQIAEIMADADIAIEPKRTKSLFGTEALSMKILEFMAAGVPVIASATAVHRYYYDDSLVQYFHDDSAEELGACILYLKECRDFGTTLVENGLAYVRENNWAVKSTEYLRIVDGLISSFPADAREVVGENAVTHP